MKIKSIQKINDNKGKLFRKCNVTNNAIESEKRNKQDYKEQFSRTNIEVNESESIKHAT